MWQEETPATMKKGRFAEPMLRIPDYKPGIAEEAETENLILG